MSGFRAGLVESASLSSYAWLFPQGDDQGVGGGIQLREGVAFRRIEGLKPAVQGVFRRFRADDAQGARAENQNGKKKEPESCAAAWGC